MSGLNGMQMWIFTLIEYDTFGNAKVLKSFSKPSEESSIKFGPRKKKETLKTKEFGTKDLF